MGELLRSLFESMSSTVLAEKDEEKVERVVARVRLGVFVAAAAFLSMAFISVGGVWGWTVATAPLALVVVTRLFGIGSLPSPVFGLVGAVVVVPATFLGLNYGDSAGLTGFVLVGYLVFFLWVTVYPSVLTDAEQHYVRTHVGPEPAIRAEAEYRILVLKLWMATASMAAIDASTAALVCFLAVGWVARWTAAVAAVACFAGAVLTYGHEGLVWKDVGPFAFTVSAIAGVLAAADWITAMRHPTWWGRGWLRVVLPRARRFTRRLAGGW